MDAGGNYHSQQTNIGKENQTLHILTHKWKLNNENTRTQVGEHYTLGSTRGNRGRTVGGGSWGGIAWGGMPDVGEGKEGSQSHCHVCTYVTVLHVLHMYPKIYNAIKNK